MSHNPYAPPTATVIDPAGPGIRPRRPGIVTFTFIMAWPILAMFGYVLVRYTWLFFVYWEHSQSRKSAYLQLALRAAFAALPLATLILLVRQPRVGRWTGALMIASFYSLPSVMLFTQAMSVGMILGVLITAGPITLWIAAFAFSKKARAWFNWMPEPEAP